MNFKEANQIVVEGWGYCSHKPSREPEEYSEAKGFIEATQAAQPLLEVIDEQNQDFKRICEMVLAGSRNAESYSEVYANVTALKNKALSSSAPVLEKYRRETLGELCNEQR